LHDIVLTDDTVRFGIDGLGAVGLKIAEKHRYDQLIIKAMEGTAADFTFWINITEASGNTSRVNIDLQANLNLFLEMMAKEPLQQFVDLMVDKLETVDF
jgi:carbon monoxide dehydrogenase subunit G